MHPRTRYLLGLTLLVLGQSHGFSADEPPARVEVTKLGKACTAMVKREDIIAYGSAFCVHPSGLFLTNDHVAQGSFSIILNAGLKEEKKYKAKVIRSDKELDLALFQIEDAKDLPCLTLGSDEKLTESIELITFGFPLGTAPARKRNAYPEVSVNVGRVSALRQEKGVLHRIQLDAALNPGSSGGPVLDKDGKVVGMVVSGFRGTGLNLAIPVSIISTFVDQPDITFRPPRLGASNIYKTVVFEAQVFPVLKPASPITVDLLLKPSNGTERAIRMEASADGRYKTSAIPLPQPSAPQKLQLRATFENGALFGTIEDRMFKVGDRAVKLSDVQKVHFQARPRVVLHEGKAIEGAISGLNAVPVRLGEQSLSLDLGKATEIRFSPVVETDQIWCTLIIRKGDTIVSRHTDLMVVEGLSVTHTASETGIKPPALVADKTIVKLSSPITDLVVGGGGRYLILHLPKLRKLAVFDVNAGEIVGHIPVKEENAKIAAGQEEAVVFLPTAGTIERWNLKTLERDAVVECPIKERIKSLAMGSASRGPLMIYSTTDEQLLTMRGIFSLFNVGEMKLISADINAVRELNHFVHAPLHMRASANGKVFGMWVTEQSPSGVGTIVLSEFKTSSYYSHNSVGHVVPTADGKNVLTMMGMSRSEVQSDERFEPSNPPLFPACHGVSYLKLPPVRKTGAVTIHVPGKVEPIATLADLDIRVPTSPDFGAQDTDAVKGDLTLDKRIHLIPDAQLIIIVPPTNDKLILHSLPK